MQEVEDKTGLIRRFEQMRRTSGRHRGAPPSEIRTINYRQYEDPRLDRAGGAASTRRAAALKE